MLALIVYCDFSPASEYLFEVRANVEHISNMCNQAYVSWDKSGKNRVRYDTVLNAIQMLEDAELITVLRETPECHPPLNKFYSIRAKKPHETLKKRRNFLKLCPDSNEDSINQALSSKCARKPFNRRCMFK
ncbi:TrbM/KikA/MpfK family conjugal transfer protein [Aggregatibacter actinomycetemcomitans]|uniref:TrbM/KikA/MpfK family conjugal transfer protein n=3 Tax=Aggregatibacter actinomycetemcomitans TaxID=714 RepID=UPI0021518C29|nr:TrbM/KikA/MpfK family conjugal transfer protein [Aggregatibacter actinomycetemcomitans]